MFMKLFSEQFCLKSKLFIHTFCLWLHGVNFHTVIKDGEHRVYSILHRPSNIHSKYTFGHNLSTNDFSHSLSNKRILEGNCIKMTRTYKHYRDLCIFKNMQDLLTHIIWLSSIMKAFYTHSNIV